jgi:TP901 family phage tail tape measure protein
MSQQVASLYANIGADTSDFEKGMSRSHSALTSFGSALGTGLVAAAALGVAAVGAVAIAVGKGVSAAADFEQNLADIASTAGMTLDQMAPLKKYLFDLALDPKLKVNLDEASAAAANLTKNGLTMDQIMGGALRQTVLLSNSIGADFGMSADMTTNVMQMFNLTADEMAGAVNNITGTLQASKMTAQDYAGALAMGGGVASSVGVDFKDFNAVMASTAYMFSSGSDAGTSFKTFLQRLTPTSQAAIDEMRSLGLYTGLTGKEYDDAQKEIAKYKGQMDALDPTSKNYSEKLSEIAEKLKVVTDSVSVGQNSFYNLEDSFCRTD